MEDLGLFYTGAFSADIYTAWFDGQKWDGNTAIGIQTGRIKIRSNSAPAAISYLGWLYIVYQSADNNDLYYAWHDGSSWSGGIPISSTDGSFKPQSVGSPGMAILSGLLFIFYRRPSTTDIYFASFDGDQWTDNGPINKQTGGVNLQCSVNPSAVAFKQLIYLVYPGANSKLYVAQYNGLAWTGDLSIEAMSSHAISPISASPPAIAAYNGSLFLAYTTPSDTTNKIYTCSFDGAAWHGNISIGSQPGNINAATKYTPAMAVLNGFLYLVYPGTTGDGKLYWCTYNTTVWAGGKAINTDTGNILPLTSCGPSTCILDTPPGTQSQWLEALPDMQSICDINLPGSHDAAAINGYPGLWTNHNSSITRQLQYGIRLLDVRLKIKRKDDGTFNVMTCHSPYGSSVNLNEFQDFPSLLEECRQFLVSNPGEFIAMILKIDDWSNSVGHETDAYNALKQLLGHYPIYTNFSNMPLLGTVRGKIVLFSQIDPSCPDPAFGVPVSWQENTSGQTLPVTTVRSFTVYVQDQFKALPILYPGSAKLTLVTNTFPKYVQGQLLLNFASATKFKGGVGVYINAELCDWFGQQTQRPNKLGWILFDYSLDSWRTTTYSTMNIVDLIIDSNLHFPAYPNKFRVAYIMDKGL